MQEKWDADTYRSRSEYKKLANLIEPRVQAIALRYGQRRGVERMHRSR
jgi:hypothetical protein